MAGASLTGHSFRFTTGHIGLVVSTPDLQIIDYGFGYTGSTHDSTAWEKTCIYKEHSTLLEDNEWVWADSAYPISSWTVAPYKKPERDLKENTVFNNHFSMVRIRSEHAIGFLKGRFQSLKSLRVNILDENAHKLATLWVVACVTIHAFAMRHEAVERAELQDDDDDDMVDADPFIRDGLSDSDSEPDGLSLPFSAHIADHGRGPLRLMEGKAKRQYLKEALLRHLERRAQRRQEQTRRS
ncbi:hypothetical protein PUNSTDRAFT_134436 [Punctularia strigosozonata HHB-11173 SS5]|uniref:uncharacterized protein n=1 Tax=Punctularia strigosozonata (strain HHB-11173) TaxID=741275 RepID=UPI0004416A00|nr:uncharacterized protein PUNSTDRAFT_134436 [Punctularia strigosozonata HHB-11173 SS5]EIN09279.1 hypothetical protein PUNSTDRAFT_134436 [Punctularia strigosozonata HHB-11173 SS5]